MDHSEYLMSLTVGQFKAIRKAYQLLVRIGIPHYSAMDMVLQCHKEKHERQRNDSLRRAS